MTTKFSEDVIPLTDLKINPGRVVKHATDARRPVLLTSRGRGVAVMQSVTEYEAGEEERSFMRAVVAGLTGRVLGSTSSGLSPLERLHDWEAVHAEGVGRTKSTLDDIASVDDPDLATLSVALRSMRNLVAQGLTSQGTSGG